MCAREGVRKGGRVVNSRLSPRSTGFEPELYSLAGVDGLKRQAIETEFFSKQIDNRAALVLMELVDQRVGYLSDADRVIFSHFLMSLRARHPGAVEKARRDGAVELRRHLDLNPEEYERIRTANDPATLAEAAERSYRSEQPTLGSTFFSPSSLIPRLVNVSSERVGP
jgi:hypothetical protein